MTAARHDIDEYLRNGGTITECPPFEFKPLRESPRKPLPESERYKRRPLGRKPTKSESDYACPSGCMKLPAALEYCFRRGVRMTVEQFRDRIKNNTGPVPTTTHFGKAGKVFHFFNAATLDLWLQSMGK